MLESTQHKLAEVSWSDIRNKGWLKIIWKGSRNYSEKTVLWGWENAGMCARGVLAHGLVLHRSECSQEMEETFESVVAAGKGKCWIILTSIL